MRQLILILASTYEEFRLICDHLELPYHGYKEIPGTSDIYEVRYLSKLDSLFGYLMSPEDTTVIYTPQAQRNRQDFRKILEYLECRDIEPAEYDTDETIKRCSRLLTDYRPGDEWLEEYARLASDSLALEIDETIMKSVSGKAAKEIYEKEMLEALDTIRLR